MRIGILTGGGDTASLNAIIHSAAVEAEKEKDILIGFKRGWKGALKKDLFEIGARDIDPDDAGTSLLSSRTNPNDEELEIIANNIEDKVDGLIAIGGDDTLTVGRRLCSISKKPICLVTKTIDNDVGKNAPEGKIDYEKIINYFPSGFATAARKAVTYASELISTTKSHERVMFLETMGRKPGWLALSTYISNPDFILVPEISLDFDDFREKLKEKYSKKGYAIVVVAEGLKYKGSEKPISEDGSKIDVFGHKRLGGVAEILAERIKKELGIENCNSDNPNLLYRCGISPGLGYGPRPSDLDKKTGLDLGKVAFGAIKDGISLNVAVLQKHENEITAELRPLDEVVVTDSSGKIIPRTLDLRFYDQKTYSITSEGIGYFQPIFSNK